MYYNIGKNPTADGSVTSTNWLRREGPGTQQALLGAVTEGFGMDSFQVDNEAMEELIFMWDDASVTTNQITYMEEWNERYNRHP